MQCWIGYAQTPVAGPQMPESRDRSNLQFVLYSLMFPTSFLSFWLVAFPGSSNLFRELVIWDGNRLTFKKNGCLMSFGVSRLDRAWMCWSPSSPLWLGSQPHPEDLQCCCLPCISPWCLTSALRRTAIDESSEYVLVSNLFSTRVTRTRGSLY